VSKYEPFENIYPVDLTVTDWLALSRNKLANECTFLAYLRTGFSMIALGAVILKWFHHLDLQILGGASIGLGSLIMVWGLVRFIIERHRYAHLILPARK
jgi:putative membrane protein